jgi:hypothetical protein
MQIVASSSPYGFSPIGGGRINNNNNMASLVSPPRGRVSPVRRRLFFSEDSADDQQQMDNRTSIIQQQLEAMQLDQQRRWNFDFNNQEPLDGRYRWFPSTATAAIERPSHPLPPPVAIKRPRNQQQQQQVVVTKMARLDWCNNNNNSSRLLSTTCQTKITGKNIAAVVQLLLLLRPLLSLVVVLFLELILDSQDGRRLPEKSGGERKLSPSFVFVCVSPLCKTIRERDLKRKNLFLIFYPEVNGWA